ncbi:hypothetical protein [Enterococcus dongliensis]|uniref:hypothetical protein n=1 Tax=Enterococcus dongliensis TaxID=2559925 RepID=UPI00288ED434|nr:hypothetical protein [Enterococcus dongliensis]MDT2674297.1 hypothetical protein [Enterococcus dongliensis]
MRYDTSITFIKDSTDSHYDPDLGEWVDGEAKRTGTVANVTDLGTERSVKVFGDVREGAKVIRTMPLFSLPEFDHIEIDGKTFKETTARNPSGRHSLIVQEVESGGQVI